jgi:non-lysosomal glucosylceramidase
VPADKKLDPAWVKSLFARGEPAVYRGGELATIGMPIGGICAGQLYLGGDGKLWHWDIFNQHVATTPPGPHYANPLKPTSPLQQGFGIRLSLGGKAEFRALDHTGFADVTLRGEYPIGRVEYRDPAVPAAITLEAFSPFIPLNAEESSLPATVLQFTVKNTGAEKLEAELLGWLENAVCLHTAKAGAGRRHNRVLRQPKVLWLDCGVEATDPKAKLGEQFDFGTMGLGLVDPQPTDVGAAATTSAKLCDAPLPEIPAATEPFGTKLLGALARKVSLEPGQSATITFVLAWHFPNLMLKDCGRFYATRFPSAAKVAEHVADNFDSLSRQTRLWRDTWYDSTLPYWFLDRTFGNTSILASSTCHWFKTGRFYGWEGVGCCEGTCTHVWHYAQAVARLFPALERDLRRRTDFGTAINPQTGVIQFRGEKEGLAVDGQAGCILRAYREHQMSADATLLKELWPKIKLAMQCLVHMDKGEGLLEGGQHNTLDQPWFGKIAWLSSLYVAAARACEAMARELGDVPFADQMRQIVQRGGQSIDRELFNGKYYLQIADAEHAKSVGSHDGCEIDQAFGQHWAYQVGLGRILDEAHVKKALASLWRYNFTPDVGPFRAQNKPGRWYAMAGEGGVIMCTWPKGDARRCHEGYDYYFNESMTGFEYQLAGHMIWEGMVKEGLAIMRAVHDRYHPSRRNPWNEIECGDHYARAMASYGVFLAACGYEYHGPKAHLGFAPRLSPENFRAAFTTAEGWGCFVQRRDGATQRDAIELRWGTLRLRSLAFAPPENAALQTVRVTVAGNPVASKHRVEQGRVEIELAEETVIHAGQQLEITIA